jgi:hypothetical protein
MTFYLLINTRSSRFILLDVYISFPISIFYIKKHIEKTYLLNFFRKENLIHNAARVK